jgi:50S ribosomal protein L16 3-hydroxylase
MRGMARKRRSSLSLLFPNAGLDRFLARQWPLRPLWSHGPVERLGSLGELGEIGNVVALAVRSRMPMKAIFAGQNQESNVMAVEHFEVIDFYDSGATVACDGVHRWNQAAGIWMQRLAHELDVPEHTCGCNLYMSPLGRGLGMHFDDHEVIVVQLSGRKRWRIAENDTVKNPIVSSGKHFAGALARSANARRPTRMPAETTLELKPGSALFLPRGFWHATDAREPSVSLTFGFRMPSWMELFRDHLAARLALDENWRAPAWHAFGGAATRHLAEDALAALIAKLPPLLAELTVEDLASTDSRAEYHRSMQRRSAALKKRPRAARRAG